MRTAKIAALVGLLLVLALLPATSGAASEAPADDLSAALAAGAEARPLAAPTPDWYTAELHEQVLAAGAEGVAIPEGADVPASALAFQGIRPGSWMIEPAWCTMNFVFNGSGSTSTKLNGNGNGNGGNGNGNAYGLSNGSSSGDSGLGIGTAGHCTEVGDEVVLVMAPGVLVYIGDTTKSVDQGIGRDFALVSIRDEVADLVNPSMAIVAGPTSTGEPAFGDAVAHVGHGVGVGTGGTPRAGVVTYTGEGDGGDAYAWEGVATPGDSGSAVRDVFGDAVGNLTHIVIGGPYVPAIIAGTTVQEMERIAGASIVHASLVPDPLP